ncbi:MAG TPA: phosphatase PAP2 family protein [Dehalococcoidia bacterium]|nr:phosphatase PAP2 family protein [Dehalococcoidia bacterium]
MSAEGEQRPPRSRAGSYVMLLPLVYMAVVGAWLVHTGNWPTADQVALALFFAAVVAGRGLGFLRDWSPFVLLILAYEALRGFADTLDKRVNVWFPVDVDRALFFGHLPTNILQDHLWTPGHFHWYDYVAAYMHTTYFIVPLAFAFCLWLWNRRMYFRFVTSYLLLSYAGFVTYLLFPVAPPWWASRAGDIPHVDTILGTVLSQHVQSHPIELAYRFFNANPVAAMPSLHAAFPTLVWLVCWKLWPRWGWALVVYPAAMALSVVYMGEHYVADVIAGWAYGASAFALVWVVPERWPGLRSRGPVRRTWARVPAPVKGLLATLIAD